MRCCSLVLGSNRFASPATGDAEATGGNRVMPTLHCVSSTGLGPSATPLAACMGKFPAPMIFHVRTEYRSDVAITPRDQRTGALSQSKGKHSLGAGIFLHDEEAAGLKPLSSQETVLPAVRPLGPTSAAVRSSVDGHEIVHEQLYIPDAGGRLFGVLRGPFTPRHPVAPDSCITLEALAALTWQTGLRLDVLVPNDSC
ncbi:hypothetical protein VUR80DRAFT_5032 [Thermomyces stellatus]